MWHLFFYDLSCCLFIGMIIDVLLNTNKSVNKIKDKTLKNYPIKKFHLNSFMNVVRCVFFQYYFPTGFEQWKVKFKILFQGSGHTSRRVVDEFRRGHERAGTSRAGRIKENIFKKFYFSNKVSKFLKYLHNQKKLKESSGKKIFLRC